MRKWNLSNLNNVLSDYSIDKIKIIHFLIIDIEDICGNLQFIKTILSKQRHGLMILIRLHLKGKFIIISGH